MTGKIKKKLRNKRKNFKLAHEKSDNVTHSYNNNYRNWAHRGNVCFDEIRKVGIHFIDEILKMKLVNEDLSTFGSSLSSLSNEINEPPKLDAKYTIESEYLEGSREFSDDLWNMLCNIIKNNSTLIPFQYHMEKEKWIDIKRNFNVFQVDGETISDITLKVVQRIQDNKHVLVYYIRILESLVKTGILSTKSDIMNITKSLGRCNYICIGFEKDKFLYQVDNNKKMRQYIKDYARLSTMPFESMHHVNCKAIVRDSLDVGNYKFKREEKTICGPLVICKPCEELYDNLEELLDPALNNVREDCSKSPTQRYGPVESLNVSTKIKKLCTESVGEFVQDARKNIDCFRKLGIETDIIPKESKWTNVDSSEDERPSVTVSEQEFEKMFSVKKISTGSLNKKCDTCNFSADSMLSLFTHMSSHIVASDEGCRVQCPSSDIHSDSEEAACPGKKKICPTCQRPVANKEFCCRVDYQSCVKPFLCVHCDMRFQTLEEYKIHMKNIHHMKTIEEMKFACATCQTYFYTHNHLIIHLLNLNHLDKAGVKCNVCSCVYSSVTEFQSHILSHSCDQLEEHNLILCRECGKFFFSKMELEHHKKDKLCRLKLKHEVEIQSKKIADSINVKIYTCGKCYKTFNSINTLQKHIECCQGGNDEESNTGVTPSPSSVYSFSCNLCGMKFASEYYLNIHTNLHTTNNRTVFQTSEDFFIYSKRVEGAAGEPSKQMDKQQQQQLLHQPTQQLPTYNQVYTQQTFPGSQSHVTQSDVMDVSSPEIDWSKQTISSMEEHSDTVYSLLHL